MERELIYLKIGVNIRVVEFDGGDNQIVGRVMEEFCGFVPVGAVVFVAFENEFRPAFEAVALAEVFGDSTDEEIGVLGS